MDKRILKIDESTRPDHFYLEAGDVCYYAGEYTAGEGHAYSATNQLILNLKKSIDTRGTAQWQYKQRAIEQIATHFRARVNMDMPVTYVPVPPSKKKSDPLYDDRIVRILHLMGHDRALDVREVVVLKESMEPAHVTSSRPTPDELSLRYEVDMSRLTPRPQAVCIVDDVLTTGSHFKAIQRLLAPHMPDKPIFGLFVARRAPKSSIEDFDIVE